MSDFKRGTVWAHEFYLATVNKKFEQCGYLFQKFLELNVGKNIYCNKTGYVNDWADNPEILKYFNQYPFNINTVRDGDWIIWNIYDALPHIAMFRCWGVDKKYMYCLDSNTGSKLASQHNLHTERACYILRLKEWDTKPQYNIKQEIYLSKPVKAYRNSDDALSGKNAILVYPQGSIKYIYKIHNGMLNLASSLSTVGGWVNPKDL